MDAQAALVRETLPALGEAMRFDHRRIWLPSSRGDAPSENTAR